MTFYHCFLSVWLLGRTLFRPIRIGTRITSGLLLSGGRLHKGLVFAPGHRVGNSLISRTWILSFSFRPTAKLRLFVTFVAILMIFGTVQRDKFRGGKLGPPVHVGRVHDLNYYVPDCERTSFWYTRFFTSSLAFDCGRMRKARESRRTNEGWRLQIKFKKGQPKKGKFGIQNFDPN